MLELGYLGPRNKLLSLGWNGLNGNSYTPDMSHKSSARFKALGIPVRPWVIEGDHALIAGQVPFDESLGGRDIYPWYEEQAELIKQQYDIPVIFRPHPRVLGRRTRPVAGTTIEDNTLQAALRRARFVVCWNSNTSVDSVLAGTPCIVGDRGSMAWDMCGKEIGDIRTPDRTQWANQLAWKQWSKPELSSGKPLKAVLDIMHTEQDYDVVVGDLVPPKPPHRPRARSTGQRPINKK